MDPKQREKCLKEVRLLESLDHPNIIKYLDSFMEENQLLIAIEWAERGDLKRIIKKAVTEDNPIDETRIWDYMVQLATALLHMHEKRIMHRDLKPANIFITVDGSLKLGDLGLGRYLSSQTLEAYSRVGTPLYMSPEVLKGNGYDWKSDVWSLGCVVYELACLRSPFKGDDSKMSLYDLFNTINKGEYPPIPERYSEEMRTMVNSMIRVDPQERLAMSQVVELCNAHLQVVDKKPRIDSYLVMDDIMEKLRLLQYERRFCIPYRRKPIPRVYFSHPGKISEQFPYFYELTYWLMAINKQYSKRRSTDLASADPIGAVINSETVEEYKELARQLVTDVRTFGVQLPEFVTTMSVSTGYGEAVCFIINDLLNKFLIKQDFKFLTPQVWQGTKDVYGSENHESDEITEEIDGDPLEDILQSAVPAPQSSDDEAPILTPPPETTTMINTQIDPTDWALEVARVSDQLVFSEEDLRAENQDWLVRMRTMIGSFRRFAGVAAGGVKEKLMGISQNWSSGLEKLGRGETMVRELCKKDLSELSAVLVRKRQIIGELNGLRERVSGKIEEFDRIKAEHEELLESIESLSQSTTDSSPLERLKTAMARLKTEIRHMELTEAITASRIAEGAVRSVSD